MYMHPIYKPRVCFEFPTLLFSFVSIRCREKCHALLTSMARSVPVRRSLSIRVKYFTNTILIVRINIEYKDIVGC